jgi:hypothetical protein
MRSASHDPFLLIRVVPHHRALGHTLRGSLLDRYDELEPSTKSIPSLRAIAWRIVGGLAVVAAWAGLALIAAHPDARNAIVDWITFGVGASDRNGDHDVQKGVEETPKP